MATIYPGPWPSLQQYFCSVDPARAFGVMAKDRRHAAGLAASRLYDDVWDDVDPDDPFACDTAEQVYAALLARLCIYEPREWDAVCLRDYDAEKARRAARSLQPMPTVEAV